MKKILYLVGLCAVWPAMAADLVRHPDGQVQSLSAWPAPVRVVNFWATWCVPCRKEMPALSRWYRQQPKGQVALIGISLDHNQQQIADFLRDTPVTYPIWHYQGKDARALMRGLGNPAGAVPYTVLEARGCRHRQALAGEVDGKKLNDALAKLKTACRLKA